MENKSEIDMRIGGVNAKQYRPMELGFVSSASNYYPRVGEPMSAKLVANLIEIEYEFDKRPGSRERMSRI